MAVDESKKARGTGDSAPPPLEVDGNTLFLLRIQDGEPIPSPLELDDAGELKVAAEPVAPPGPAPEVEGPARDIDYPAAPFLGSRLVEEIPLASVAPYINERTLFQFQWGYPARARAWRSTKPSSMPKCGPSSASC